MWQEIHDKEYWNNLVARIKHAPFLQSWQWGGFQESLGREVRRLSWGDKIIAQAIRMPLPLGKSYWYIPRGPIVADDTDDISALFDLEKNFTDCGLFLRVDPIQSLRAERSNPGIKTSGLLRRPACGGTPRNDNKKRMASHIVTIPSVQAQCVRILDIRKSADQLLAAMHPKTRYNINLAQRKGVVVGPGNIGDFLRLNRATRQRDKFRPHPDYYYQKMTELLSRGDAKISPPRRPVPRSLGEGGGGGGGWCELHIWQASYRDKVLASAIIVYFGDTASYVHGASSDEHREVMAPHLLHWEIVKDARAHNFNYYDLGGVNPEDKNHQAYKKTWEGISRFKAGFGGEVVCYPDSFDLIYQPNWYRLYWLAKKFL